MAASRQQTTQHVAAVFSRYPNENLTVRSIVRILKDEFQVERTESQVSSSCSRLVADPRFPGIHSPSRGVYVNEPDAVSESGDRVFSEVGPTKDGRIVLECTDGSLYVAEPL